MEIHLQEKQNDFDDFMNSAQNEIERPYIYSPFSRRAVVVYIETAQKLKKDFEIWKKQAKEKIFNYKYGKITEDEIYKWLEDSK